MYIMLYENGVNCYLIGLSDELHLSHIYRISDKCMITSGTTTGYGSPQKPIQIEQRSHVCTAALFSVYGTDEGSQAQHRV